MISDQFEFQMAKGVIDEKEKSLTQTRTQLKAESQKVKSLEEVIEVRLYACVTFSSKDL